MEERRLGVGGRAWRAEGAGEMGIPERSAAGEPSETFSHKLRSPRAAGSGRGGLEGEDPRSPRIPHGPRPSQHPLVQKTTPRP